jgi:hypothetical protein
MTSPEGVQEPSRRIHVEKYSQTPRDDSILVAATVHPVIFGAPRPKTGRQCEAGFLASGFSLSPAFPTFSEISGNSDDRSPVTVAGAATVFHRVPYTLHLAAALRHRVDKCNGLAVIHCAFSPQAAGNWPLPDRFSLR